MVFEIASKDTSQNWLYPMFYIEVVTDFGDKTDDQNKINVTTYSTGIIHFLSEKKADENFDYQEFAKYCLSIENIIKSLNKDHLASYFDNKETRTTIGKEINDIVQIFVEKYNLILKQ